jgi:hypothetical protein
VDESTVTGLHHDSILRDPSSRKASVGSNIVERTSHVSQIPNLQNDIRTIIGEWKRNTSIIEVEQFLSERLQECSLEDVCNLMRILGKKSNSKVHSQLLQHILSHSLLLSGTFLKSLTSFMVFNALKRPIMGT